MCSDDNIVHLGAFRCEFREKYTTCIIQKVLYYSGGINKGTIPGQSLTVGIINCEDIIATGAINTIPAEYTGFELIIAVVFSRRQILLCLLMQRPENL